MYNSPITELSGRVQFCMIISLNITYACTCELVTVDRILSEHVIQYPVKSIQVFKFRIVIQQMVQEATDNIHKKPYN